jgi:hypothetical protein
MPIESIQLDSATELLAHLDPLHRLWGPNPSLWIFRGHSDSSWPLTPPALRNTTTFGYGSRARRGLHSTHADQVEVEFHMLDRFLQSLNRHGHSFPPDVHAIWFKWGEIMERVRGTARRGEGAWPFRELYGLVALAQHHGVPTRLLDWSLNARTAAFFAAERAAQWTREGFPGGDPVESLCIWAFQEPVTRDLWQGARDLVALIHPPAERNLNLRAQQGVFTLHINRHTAPDQPPIAASVDDLVRQKLESPPEDWKLPEGTVIMRKLSLPVAEAPKLLRLLAYQGVTGASVYPTLDGAVYELVETRYWDWPE